MVFQSLVAQNHWERRQRKKRLSVFQSLVARNHLEKLQRKKRQAA